MRYAIVKDDVVVNLVLWDGETPWSPPEDCAAVSCDDNDDVDIGWAFSDGEFTAPPPPEEE